MARKKLNVPSKSELEEFYNETKSISKSAKHFGTSNPTMRSWLNNYNIQTLTQLEASRYDTYSKCSICPPKNELESLYKKTSIFNLAKIYNTNQSIINKWLDSYDIPRISLSDKVKTTKTNIFSERFPLSKDQIEKDYSEALCMGTLAENYGCSMTTIKKLFKMYNVEAKFAKSSVGQNQIAEYIKSLGFDIDVNNRFLIRPLELDIILHDKKIAIEYCGVYYHSETWGNKDKNYHLRKQQLCNNIGYELITIFESEWNTKKEIIKSILANKLGVTSIKIYARNTVFRKLEYKDIKDFENDNHLQKSRQASKYYGLYNGAELVMTASFGCPRYNKKYKYELIRLTSKKNTSIIGGLSKIFKNADIHNCITYSDKRFGKGNSYIKAGFIKMKDSNPNYFYFHKKDHNTLYSRHKFQKHKIPNSDKNKTEYENMMGLGYDRIWDCGNSVYILA